MGSWDLNGDGSNQSVFNEGSFVRVEQPNGGFRNYHIGNDWVLLRNGVVNTNRAGNKEMVFNFGSSIKIVDDKSQKIRTYRIGSGWRWIGTSNTDNVGGKEIVFKTSTDRIKILSDEKRLIRTYFPGSGWVLLRGGFEDLDGIYGDEIALSLNGVIKIITDRNGSVASYSVGSNWRLPDSGIVDTDNVAGSEIIIEDTGFGSGRVLRILRHRTGEIKPYALGAGAEIVQGGVANVDGRPGRDIVFKDGPFLKTVIDRYRKINTFHIGNSFWRIANSGIVNFDNEPGREVICLDFGSDTVRVVNSRLASARDYALSPGNWWEVGSAVGDSDGDGLSDLFMRKTETGEVALISSRFSSPRIFPIGITSWSEVGSGLYDTKGEGRVGLVINDHRNGLIKVIDGVGSGTIRQYNVGLLVRPIAVVDADGNGGAEIIYDNWTSNTVGLIDEKFASGRIVSVNLNTRWDFRNIEVVDYDSDGDKELLFSDIGSSAQLLVDYDGFRFVKTILN